MSVPAFDMRNQNLFYLCCLAWESVWLQIFSLLYLSDLFCHVLLLMPCCHNQNTIVCISWLKTKRSRKQPAGVSSLTCKLTTHVMAVHSGEVFFVLFFLLVAAEPFQEIISKSTFRFPTNQTWWNQPKKRKDNVGESRIKSILLPHRPIMLPHRLLWHVCDNVVRLGEQKSQCQTSA